MEKESRKFRSKFGGYNKKDVNEYIAAENSNFMQMRDEMQNLLDDCEERIHRLELEAETSENEKKALADSLAERNALIESYKTDAEALNAKIADLETEIDALNSTIDELRAKNAELELKTDEPAVIVDERMLEKARSYDSLCGEIDEILSYAKKQAEEIIRTAKATAETAHSTPRSGAEDIDRVKQEISKKSSSILSDLRGIFRK